MRNTVKWARRWSQEKIDKERVRDHLAKKGYFQKRST